MNVLGIIAEYNPFHSGHAYQLQTCRKMSDADFTMIVLGSDFNQRGTPSIVNKYIRTQMALAGGADLVIEMPQLASCASAAYFAASGVSLMANSGVVTHLGFGSESGKLESLDVLSDLILNESPKMSENIQNKMKQGQTYASARNAVISSISETALENPNDILAVEYIRAIKELQASIKPLTIKRQGQSYHDPNHSHPDGLFLSATAIRKITTEQHTNGYVSLLQVLKDAIPESALETFVCHLLKTKPLTADDFHTLQKYSLLYHQNLTEVFDINEDYANRLLSFKDKYGTFDQWVGAVKSRNYTWTKVSRSLSHIMLNQTKYDDSLMKSMKYAPYIRILGFKKSASALLKALKNNSTIPLITKMADAKNILNSEQLYIFEKAVFSERIYKSVEQTKSSQSIRDVFQESPVIFE